MSSPTETDPHTLPQAGSAAHDDSAAALEGVRVLEVGYGIAGAFGARLLADLGADVVKVEAPDGDWTRTSGPLVTDSQGASTSALFEYLNWNKRSVVLDLDTPESHGTWKQLVEWADVVIDSAGPACWAAWGIAEDDLQLWRPSVVRVKVSSFGTTGPYAPFAATDLVHQAMGGLAQLSGTVGSPPIKAGLRQSLYWAGLNVAHSALAGYLGASRTGAGVQVDLAIRDCVAAQLVVTEPLYAFGGAVQGRRPQSVDPLSGDPVPTADGYLTMQVNYFTPIERVAEFFGDSRLATPEFATEPGRKRHSARLRSVLESHLSTANSRETFVRAASAGLLAGCSQSAADLLSCPHLAARGAFTAVDHLTTPDGPLRLPASVMTLSRTPTRVGRRAPHLGEHGEEIAELLSRLLPAAGRSTRVPAEGPEGGQSRPGPLAGLRVIDLSTVFAVPYLAALLSDLGADVVKVESPRRLDQTRAAFGVPFAKDEEYWDSFSAFQNLNRGKRSIALDLSLPAGREVLRRLVRGADIMLDNYTPRVLRGWGLTHDDLRQDNPGLISLSNTGYGANGPWSSFKAQGTTLEATMGLTHYTGYADGPPAKAGQSLPDFPAAWAGLTALLAALVHRDRTGMGQSIDIGMYQLGPATIPEALIEVQLVGEDLPRLGARDLDSRFGGVFRTQGEDRWLAISPRTDDELVRLLTVVRGLSDGPQVDADSCDLGRIEAEVTDWCSRQDARQAMCALQRVGVPAGVVQDVRDLLTDPQLRHRGFFSFLDYGPGLGPRPIISRPFTWDSQGSEVEVRSRAPRFGSSNDEVLREWAGMSPGEIANLRHAGVVVDRPIDPQPCATAGDLADLLAAGSMNLSRIDSDVVAVIQASMPVGTGAGSPMGRGVR